MTDDELIEGIEAVKAIEARARRHWQTSPINAEQALALDLVRHITPAIRDLEAWVSARAVRAHSVKAG
jgi:hypothetical protein